MGNSIRSKVACGKCGRCDHSRVTSKLCPNNAEMYTYREDLEQGERKYNEWLAQVEATESEEHANEGDGDGVMQPSELAAILPVEVR